MRSVKNHQGMTLGLIISLSLLAYGCGGGGGDGGSTPANAKSAAAATKSAINAFSALDSGTSTGDSPSKANAGPENDAKKIRKGIAALKTRLQGASGKQKALHETIAELCISGSGSTTFDDTSFTETYNNCDLNNGDGTITRKNGTIVATFDASTFNSTITNFEESVIRTEDSVVLKYEKTNGTFVMSGGTLTHCEGVLGNPDDDEFFFSNGVVTVNATFEEKVDEDGNGILEQHETFTGNNFRMTISESFNAADCSLAQDTLVMNGTTSFADNLHPTSDDNFTATFTNYTMARTERKVNGTATGDQLILSGTVAITSPCATGTYTVTTETALFFPTDAECPVEGKVLVTGGGLTTSVTATASGGVDVDEGNDGTIDKSFETCDDSDVCS